MRGDGRLDAAGEDEGSLELRARVNEVILHFASATDAAPAGADLTDITLLKAQRVTSCGQSYVLAHVIAGKSYRMPSGQALGGGKSRGVVVLDNDLKVVALVGASKPADLVNGDNVIVSSLGSASAWFAWTYHYAPQGEYSVVSDVYLIGPKLPIALRVWHHTNDMGYTDTAEQAKVGGSFFMLCGKESQLEWYHEGTGRDGRAYRARLVWNDGDMRFRGPATVRFHGDAIYEVDRTVSTLFEATDGADSDERAE